MTGLTGPAPSPLFDTSQDDTIELLQRQVAIQRQLIAFAKDNGIAMYRPHFLQHAFHSSTAKRRGAFTGNRFGKSHMDAAETAAWMT